MRHPNKNIALTGIVACILTSCVKAPTSSEPLLSKQADFCNLINIKNTPAGAVDWDAYVFADKGAWMAYSLPDNENRRHAGAFMGPMVMTGRGWIAAGLAEPTLWVNGEQYRMVYNVQTTRYLPGKLIQEYNDENLNFTTELCYLTSRSVAIRSIVKNMSQKPVKVSFDWNGGVYEPTSVVSSIDKGLSFIRPKDSTNTVIRFLTADKIQAVGSDSLHVTEKSEMTLEPGKTYQSEMTQTLTLRGEDTAKELAAIATLNIDNCFELNEQQWNAQIASLLSGNSKYLKDNKYRKVLVKAMMTLNSNYRTPAGDILHGGSNPSYNGFINGIWSWDSWKIASGNVHFNEEIAKSEMITLFDYQADNGMVPDFISYNKKYNNWRDAKPPVAAWGAMNVYKATGDKKFLETMFDKLYKFHQWWYAERDHNHNGICEYGSTDGTLIAACWESGMDNAIRFDGAVMLKNEGYEDAWSMDQESVDLNAYLALECKLLKKFSSLLKIPFDAPDYSSQVADYFFDKNINFFCDRRLKDGSFIEEPGCEAYTPLWTRIATQAQVDSMLPMLQDTAKFSTYIPFPTIAADNPKYNPRGYWRGPIWLDQTYFAIRGLRNYGYNRLADEYTLQVFDRLSGLKEGAPIHENYGTHTGERLKAPHFSWSSSHLLMMYDDYGK